MATNFPAGANRMKLVEALKSHWGRVETWVTNKPGAGNLTDYKSGGWYPHYNGKMNMEIRNAWNDVTGEDESGGDFDSNNALNVLVSAQVFYAALEEMDAALTEEEWAWLVDPLPRDHPWIQNLSDFQKNRYWMKNWSLNARYDWGNGISRLEYWSINWMDVEEPSSTAAMQLNFGPYTPVKGAWKNKPWSEMSSGLTYPSDKAWLQTMKDFNAAETKAAFDIMWRLWGVVYDGGGSGRTNVPSGLDEQPRLFQDKSEFHAKKVLFVGLLAQNQGYGRVSYSDWGQGPWVTHGSSGVAENQWFATGTAVDGWVEGDTKGNPLNFAILQKLLYSEAGYNKPFDLGGMTWEEVSAFMTPAVNDDGIETSAANMSSQARYQQTLTASSFLTAVLAFLKSDESVNIWDGKADGAMNKISVNLRETDFTALEPGWLHTGEKGRPQWRGRDNKQDGEDWDSGLFYWEDDKEKQIEQARELNMNNVGVSSAGERYNQMGLARLVTWLTPSVGKEHWLTVSGDSSNIGDGHFDEYMDMLLQFVLGEQYEFEGISTWNRIKRSAGVLGLIATHTDIGDEFQEALGMGDGRNDSMVITGGERRYPTFKPHIKGTGFVNWEGWVKNELYTDQHLNGEKSDGEDTGVLGSMLLLSRELECFLPLSVHDGFSEKSTANLTGDLVLDVNNIAGTGLLKGSFWEAEPVSDSETAKENVKAFKDMFLEFAGSKDKGRGPKESQALGEWFANNFKTNALVPAEQDQEGSFLKMDLKALGLTDELLTAAEGLLGGTNITVKKPHQIWSVYRKMSGPTDMNFDEIIRMYQGAAYLSCLYYQKNKKKLADVIETDGAQVQLSAIWEHYAFKCAYHMYRVWEKLNHDHQVGNMYALMCVILSDADAYQSEAAKELMEALMGILRKADDDAMDGMTEEAPPEPEEEDTQTSKDQRERFYKQCALLLNMHLLHNKFDMNGIFHEESIKEGFTSYNGRIHLLTNENGKTQKNTILNKLITPTPKVMSSFVNIAPDKASELLPYVRFFRVWNDKKGAIQEIEFDFPKFGKTNFSGKFDRGDGVGLEEFTWECDGETPATASKYINATMTMHFQSFDDFTRPRRNKANAEFRWVDMFVSPTNVISKPGKEADTPVRLKYDSEYYRIRVDVGYHTDIDIGEALATQNRSFFLVLKDNEITVNSDMSVTIKANYGAYIEEAMDSNKFNALTTPAIRAKMADYKIKWDKATVEHKEGRCTDLALRDLRALINSELEGLIKLQHKSIMTNLLNQNKIYYADFEPKHIDNYRKTGTFTSIPKFKDSDSLSPDSNPARHLKAKIDAKDNPDRKSWEEHREPHKDYRVYYFYLGDLIYLLNCSMYEGLAPWKSKGLFAQEGVYAAGAENSKLLLMDFDYHNPLVESDSSRQSINIAHIPVSVDFFFQWYVNNIIKNEIYNMGVGNFMKRILTELITEALSEVCLSSEEGNYVSFQHGSISVAGIAHEITEGEDPVFTDPITSMLMLEKGGDNPWEFDVADYYGKTGELGAASLPLKFIPDERVLKQFNKNGVQGQYQYIYIYADSKDPHHVGRGDEKKDNTRGCFHLHLGKNNGLVKNISFSKNNIPYLRESRMFNQGQAGLLQLSAVYDCEIEMLGNTLFLPGQEVWVNPYGFGGDAFGKPQDRPLEWSPDASDIDRVNDLIRDKQADGTVTAEEHKEIADAQDQIDAEVRAAQTANLKVNSYANVMGIGGYQLIIRTKTSIKPGSFTTTINAKHTFSGYPSIKQSLDMVEFRAGRPADISSADAGSSGINACEAIVGRIESGIEESETTES